MHPGELAELAALVATHGPALIHTGQWSSASSTEQYWISSRCRLDRWSRSLKAYSTQIESRIQEVAPDRHDPDWQHIRSVIEEILSSQMLTRVWTAVACGLDRTLGVDRLEPQHGSSPVGQKRALSTHGSPDDRLRVPSKFEHRYGLHCASFPSHLKIKFNLKLNLP